MRKYAPVALAMFLFAGLTVAGAIKTWGSGDTLLSSDLNGNFQHIHNVMVGGHGARLVNADVSNSAAIRYSKMQTPVVVPRIFGVINCTTSCTLLHATTTYLSGYTISPTIGGTAGTTITVNFTSPLADATYWPVVTRVGVQAGATEPVVCYVSAAPGTGSFTVECKGEAGSPPITNVTFAIQLYDDTDV